MTVLSLVQILVVVCIFIAIFTLNQYNSILTNVTGMNSIPRYSNITGISPNTKYSIRRYVVM